MSKTSKDHVEKKKKKKSLLVIDIDLDAIDNYL